MIMISKNFRKDRDDKKKKTIFNVKLNAWALTVYSCKKYDYV